jgi:tripartite-type tricarboxylate transporter receptor subunit TctC
MMTRTEIVRSVGSAPALTDMMGGHVMMMFDNTLNVLPHVRSARSRRSP